ncbi:hypothetical protein [Tumebacillus flagellatus]|uniref:Uncharacterized protein n=1 Tax=Tumebacillus flagellatus TaxID=1157490 RepID=A0A074LPV4_9BACL|nr:hypothetical protein [Tumebacillus flagellatus]KEO84146.1 hypothetical protein EL26_06685 [Tumebacillus flagellatus]
MSDSLLIQVDDVTKSMLETIEERIFDGTRRSQETALQEFSERMEQVQQTLQRSLDTAIKQAKLTNEQMLPLQSEIQRMGRTLQEMTNISQSEAISTQEAHATLLQQLHEMEQRLLAHVEQSATQLFRVQQQFNEQFAQIKASQQRQSEQNQELLTLCALLVTKMEAVENDVKWCQKPIWQRLFGGRR